MSEMSDQVFNLYARVQRKDRQAEDELRRMHRGLFPRSPLSRVEPGDEHYRTYLHTMYLNVHRAYSKRSRP